MQLLENLLNIIPSFIPWLFPDLNFWSKVMFFLSIASLIIIFTLVRKIFELKKHMKAQYDMQSATQNELEKVKSTNAELAKILEEKNTTLEKYDLLIWEIHRMLNAITHDKLPMVRRTRIRQIIDVLEQKNFQIKESTKHDQ